MLARAWALARSSEYVAMQACLAPWPLPVQDSWAVATPGAARELAALPREDEPRCCEAWVEHRLKAMGVLEPSERADAEHPPACRRKTTLGVLPPSGTSSSRPVFFQSRLHALHLGARCFHSKMQRKKRLANDHASCTWPRPGAAASAEELAASVGLRPADARRGDNHNDGALLRLLNGSTPMDVLSEVGALIRRSACRCAHGAAAAG